MSLPDGATETFAAEPRHAPMRSRLSAALRRTESKWRSNGSEVPSRVAASSTPDHGHGSKRRGTRVPRDASYSRMKRTGWRRRVRDGISVFGMALALSACGGGGSSSSGGGTGGVVVTPTPSPTASACSPAHPAGLGARPVQRMVLLSRDARLREPVGVRQSLRFVDALTATARLQGKDRYFTLCDLDRRRKCLLRQRYDRRLRDSARPSISAARRLWVTEAFEGRPPGAECGYRSRCRDPRSGDLVGQHAGSQRHPREPGRGRSLQQQRPRCARIGHPARQGCGGHARRDPHPRRFRHRAGLVALRHEGHHRQRPQGRLHQPADLHRPAQPRCTAFASFKRPGHRRGHRRPALQWRRRRFGRADAR